MGNCLKTQLKAEVSNDNLRYFGAFEIEVDQVTDVGVVVNLTNSKIYAVNGTFDIQNGSTGQTYHSGAATIIPKTAGMKILIKNKYSLNWGILYMPANSKYFLVLDTVTGTKNANIQGYGFRGTLNMATSDRMTFSTNDTTTGYNVVIPDDFQNTITSFTVKNGNVSAKLSSLTKSVNMTTFNAINSVGVSGEVKDLLDALYNSGNGKTSGSLTLGLSGTSCTYNGEPITSSSMVFNFSSEGWTLA